MDQSFKEKVESQPERKWGLFFRVFVIVAVGWWIFWPTLRGAWLWDDNIDITQNSITRGSTGLWDIWFKPGSQSDYYPIKASVQWVQWHLWRDDTLGYHLTNVILHLVSALLVWRLFDKLGLGLAWLGGLLFAVHPTAVESVAWIAELKNTLSLPPFLLAICAYLDYDKDHRQGDYRWAVGWFFVALLCKTTMVMFPVVILLYVWWKRGRIERIDLKVSALFFGLSLVLGLVTIGTNVAYRQLHHFHGGGVPLGGFFSRLALAGLSLSFYFSKAVLPVNLAPIYPQWPVNPPSLVEFLPWPILFGFIFWLWTKRHSWGRHALFGLGFFLIMLIPFVSINVGGYTRFTWVMDHFLYIPVLGLIGLVLAALEQINGRVLPSRRLYGIGILVCALVWLAWESHTYAGKFINPETLWAYTIQRNPGAWPAYNNLGYALQLEGRGAEGIPYFKEALRLKPDYDSAHNNLGSILIERGRYAEAIQQFEEVLRSNPDNASAHNNFGDALMLQGRGAEAIEHFNAALRLKPDFFSAHNNLGSALLHEGRAGDAVLQFEEALRLSPEDGATHHNCGLALAQAGQFAGAIGHYQAALRINPNDPVIHRDFGLAFVQLGQFADAIGQYQEAVRLKPDYAEAQSDWGWALAQEGALSGAIGHYQEALRLKPDYAEAHSNFGIALAQSNHLPEAIEHFQEATQLKPDFVVAYGNWGLALARVGRTSEAIEKFEETLRLDPNNATAQAMLTRLHASEAPLPGK